MTQIAMLVAGVVLAGSGAQLFVAPGPWALVASAVLAGVAVLALGFIVPGKLRQTLIGFRFVASLLIALAVAAILGTLVLQGKPEALYRQRYGAVGDLIVALRLDDIFHSVWFGGLVALFGASVVSSAIQRWPVKLRSSGFFVCHVGLITSLLGAAASSTLSVKGRVDLHAGGESASAVAVTKSASGARVVPLGFALRLDRFDVVRYNAEYRVAFYAPERVKVGARLEERWKLKASFDPDLAKHRLPGGDGFRLKAIYPDFTVRPRPAAAGAGEPALEVTLDGRSQWLFPGGRLDGAGGLAVLFDRAMPKAPDVPTAVLVSADAGRALVRRAGGESAVRLEPDLHLADGLVRFGDLIPAASREAEYTTRSTEWRNPAVLLELREDGHTREALLSAQEGGALRLARAGALVFERRDDEVKAFRSEVTALAGETSRKAVVTVNDPFSFGGWTFYQANYDPKDPTYSGFEAVKDPGVSWVFLGFALICAGVAWMFYVEPRLRRGGVKRAPAGA
ncbi:MAG TPA: cytochrome c biogenesis protein ResB [Anaeromyxobacteraceae bacterium]|nr:cytochrome c biogenesis protein ResB [Anaeromyxobacteraceae bacterium]